MFYMSWAGELIERTVLVVKAMRISYAEWRQERRFREICDILRPAMITRNCMTGNWVASLNGDVLYFEKSDIEFLQKRNVLIYSHTISDEQGREAEVWRIV